MKRITIIYILLFFVKISIAQELDSLKHEVVFNISKPDIDSSSNKNEEKKILIISKSLDIEKDYSLLKTTYNTLIESLEASGYEKQFNISPSTQVKKRSLTIAGGLVRIYTT